jgi:hypothetical protein
VTADFPHDTRFAYTVVDSIREKYEACTEREKREITRSDIEFIYIIMSAVALRCGFKNIKDCFDIDESTLNIPKIPRGKELFWSELGDPDPEVSGLANIHEEIQTAWGGNIVRLTPIGLQSCRRIPGWQKDF